MTGTYVIVEKIDIWVSTPLVLSRETYAPQRFEIMHKGKFVQNHVNLL